jgi:predicted CoA-binding protein
MHPLEALINEPEPLVLIGDSREDRFPGYSYNAYTQAGKRFYCVDLGGLAESRGPTKGGKVYASAADLPADRGDLAVIWVKPGSARRAVEVAHQAGCKRVWFSFQTGHRDAVSRARELGLTVVEIGRCPVYYLSSKPAVCQVHAFLVRARGTYGLPPQTDPGATRRELL